MILENISSFPDEINYFRDIQALVPTIRAIRNDLAKIESIERFDSRRSYLIEQKQKIEALAQHAAGSFYEPFAAIWSTAFEHWAELIEQEINIVQGTAVLSIDLKNPDILTSETERMLYFEIFNKGQELAKDISVQIECDMPYVLVCKHTQINIPILESGMKKEIGFPVMAISQIHTTIRGIMIFSDRAKAGKQIPFSFQVNVSRESAVFREIENPYIAGNPLNPDALLYFGRQDAYEFIDKNILTRDGQRRTIVCFGLRRTGKSSLLLRISKQGFTDKRLTPVYIDMQGIYDETDFYKTVCEKISEKTRDVQTECRDFGQFKRFMKQSFAEKIMVLLIDEFEEIQMRVEHGRMSASVFSNIRHLMQHEDRLAFVFCGTHKLEEMSADYWSIFFNTALYLKISFLDRENTIRLITEPVNGQLSYDTLAVDQIIKLTHGQPYLTQLMCHTLVSDLNDRKKRNYAVIDDADDAAETIIQTGNDRFSEQIWRDSTLTERILLSVIAQELTEKQLDVIGFDSICDKAKLIDRNYSEKHYAETLEKLASKDILSEKEMRYSFPVNLLRKWIYAKHPLRRMKAEAG